LYGCGGNKGNGNAIFYCKEGIKSTKMAKKGAIVKEG